MKGLLAFSVLSALPALASVQSALSANVLPSNITRGLIQGGNGREKAEKGGKQGV